MKYAIFSSVGDDDKFLNFYHNQLDCCDLFVNFYGSDDRVYSILKKYSKNISRINTTKFPSLKSMYNNSELSTYDYVFVFDDDCIIMPSITISEYGNLCDIPILMKKYNLDIASPCHSDDGKISHKIMKYHAGNHIFRYVNFIEMNFPIFSKRGLQKYMSTYDGKLCGWGNDWWYLNTIHSFKEEKNCGIVDSICVKNPNKTEKCFPSIDNFMQENARALEWQETKIKFNLKQWQHRTMEFIYA